MEHYVNYHQEISLRGEKIKQIDHTTFSCLDLTQFMLLCLIFKSRINEVTLWCAWSVASDGHWSISRVR